ncbi:MAG TPA: GFA family protein [Candidatus Obscuribacterales bacterium]
MQTYTGTCHCGQVKVAFRSEPLEKALRCNCSICQRLGVLMTPRLDPAQLEVISGREAVKVYLHGDKEIKFSFCSNCSVFVFFEPAKPDGFCRVNLNCVDELDQNTLEVVFFDGKHLL